MPREEPPLRLVWWGNLVLPGAGLILLGSLASGLLGGLLFAACANFVIAAVFLFPDEFSATHQALGIGLAGGAYLGTQLRLAQAVRDHRKVAAEARRRQCLRRTEDLLVHGDTAAALEAIMPISDLADSDLLVAYRLAQALTAAGDAAAAHEAWQRVRRLDQHAIYKRQIDQAEQDLATCNNL